MAKPNVHNDQELALALRQGDALAFDAIYEKYWDKLLAIPYRITQDKDLSEEIVQEVFIGIWKRREEVIIDSLPNYLATAVKFSTFKSLERARRRTEIEAGISLDIPYILDEEIEARFLKEYLDGIVETLPNQCKLVFRMSREDHMTHQEISKKLSISPKAVEGHVTKALRVLRSAMRKIYFITFVISILYLF